MRNNKDNSPVESGLTKLKGQKKSREVEEKEEQEGKKNGSPIPLPDDKAVDASERRIPGEFPTEDER